MLKIKYFSKIALAICAIFLFSCEKKACDCNGLIDNKLTYGFDNSTIGNCSVIENLQLNADSTVTLFRYYKDSDGNERESELQSAASWVPISGIDCAYKINLLRPQSYSFPSVESDCNSSVNTNNTFFYDLQFQDSKILTVTDINCDILKINGTAFTW